MINLRAFAKKNPSKARCIIVLAHIILPFLAFYFGGLMYDMDWVLPAVLVPILVLVFIFTYYFYPRKKRKKSLFKYSYRLQKSLDFTFVMTSFLLIATHTNTVILEAPESHNSTAEATFIVLKKNKPPAKENAFTKPFKKIKAARKQLRAEIRAWKKSKQTPKDKGLVVEKVILIIFTVLVALGLAFLIVGLSCNLSCSGHETLAIVVLIGGLAGIGVGLFFAIRSILKMGNKESRT